MKVRVQVTQWEDRRVDGSLTFDGVVLTDLAMKLNLPFYVCKIEPRWVDEALKMKIL